MYVLERKKKEKKKKEEGSYFLANAIHVYGNDPIGSIGSTMRREISKKTKQRRLVNGGTTASGHRWLFLRR